MTKKCVEGEVEIKLGENTINISIYRNGSKPNLYYYFRYKGVRYMGSCKSSILKTSKENVREICYDLVKGLRPKGLRTQIKLGTIIKDFLEYKQNEKISSKTLVEYTRQLEFIRKWYDETSKGMDINIFFKTDRYEDYCNWRRSYYETHDNIQTYEIDGEPVEGRTYRIVGNPSLNRECLLMGQLLKYGKKNKGILRDVHIPEYKVKLEKSKVTPKVILDDLDEYNKVKKYWKEKDEFIWDCFGTIHHLGLRPSELGKIKYKDIHLKEGYVEILERKSKSKKFIVNSSVPLVKSSREIFERLMKRDGVKKGKDDPVFVRVGMTKPYTSPYLSKLFKKSVKKVTGKDMTLHSLRHLFITRYMSENVNIKLISGIVGHVDTRMLNTYSHLGWKDGVKVFQRIERQREEEKKREQKKEQEQKQQTDIETDVPNFT